MTESTTKSLAGINRDYWDKNADKVFQQEWVQQLGNLITRVLRTHVDIMGFRKASDGEPPVRMLDYACGDGLASWAMTPFVDVIRGIDVSGSMVELFNERVRQAGISSDKMAAVRGDLFSDDLSSPDLVGFDLAVMSMALHHLEEPAALLSKIVERLNPGGVIAVLDWTPAGEVGHHHGDGLHHEHHPHHQKPDAARTIKREDLSPQTVFAMLEGAGCDVASAYYVVVGEASHIPEQAVRIEGGVWKNLFLAFARKAGVEEIPAPTRNEV